MTKLNSGAWSSTHKHAYRSRRSAAPLTEVAEVVNATSSPSRTNHTGTTCGLPSLRAVATLAVRVPSMTNARHCSSVILRIACERTPLTHRLPCVRPIGEDRWWSLRRSRGEALMAMAADDPFRGEVVSRRRFLAPLALAQFICSFAGSNMNVMINDITEDLDTTVQGVQAAITLFLLIMAILMIPGSKLSDRWGRKRCFTLGLVLYGIGALLSAVSPGLGVLILGNSVLEGVGTALLIPPVYILTTLHFGDVTSRAKAFGVISGMGGIGAAAGPLIGGVITTAISWRAAFVFQACVIAAIVLLSRRMEDPIPADPTRPFDGVGAILSAVGMFCVVFGILQADQDVALMALFLVIGAAFLAAFFLYIRSRERAGKEALLSTGLFKNRASNLGLATQNIQWLILMGTSFTVAVFLQTVRGYDAIETGVVFTAATLGVLVSSLAAERFAKRRAQKTLILAGFV